MSWRWAVSCAVVAFAFLPSCLCARPAETLNLMPIPLKVTMGEGRLGITQSFRIDTVGCPSARVAAAAKRFVARLAKQTGMPINPGGLPGTAQPAVTVTCHNTGKRFPALDDDESYTLEVSSTKARLDAAEPAGVLHGFETLLQLVELDADGFGAPAVRIEDRPRFAWRGLLIDMAHHFMPIEALKRNIDAMAAVKMNVLQLHLTSDYGFRIESKVYPRLHGMGSDGDYYSQEQMRALIAYAAERGVRILAGFEMPGHIRSWFVGYPELAAQPGPYELKRFWGLSPQDPVLDVTREEIYTFLDGLIGEMAALFPDEYVHIGGDEVRLDRWSTEPRIQAFMRDHGMKAPADLQAYFNRRLEPIVIRHGKKMVGWDEVLHPELPKSTVVHVWRAGKTLGDAVRQGHFAILSYGYYLDHMRPASFHYAVDPVGEDLAGFTPEEQARVLGGHACMWSEHLSPETLDGRVWPRAAAIAERLWSPPAVNDTTWMYQRLAVVSRELEQMGLTHHSAQELMLERLAAGQPVAPLEVLVSALEPMGLGGRARAQKYFQYTPLNRLVDATLPESDAAREFAALVQRKQWDQVFERLVLWRDNHARTLPVLLHSALLREAVPVSESLSAAAGAGLQALEYVKSGHRATQDWLQQQMKTLDRAAGPVAEVNIAVLPHIRKLVESAAGR